ncbi:class I SAM-dependent methyltransferase [Tenacibaculum geojense]|uniref:Class I SAM-dependent methyltransferase n=1 Tax=Tenacibaculum geojense TaxID=915352 RepID=A0ABW3JPD0_9FLAO
MLNESDCKNTTINYQQHWDTAYSKTPTEKLGWYEKKSEEILTLVQKTTINNNASILNVGVGASTIVKDLLDAGFLNIIANDLSKEALRKLEEDLNDNERSKVTFLQDDLLHPKQLSQLTSSIDLWIDRAVLHFFTSTQQQKLYFKLLHQLVKPSGYVIIAVFAENGAEKCCGLPLQRYNSTMLQQKLGDNFTLIEKFNHVFVNPNGGERPYIYTLFQRKA